MWEIFPAQVRVSLFFSHLSSVMSNGAKVFASFVALDGVAWMQKNMKKAIGHQWVVRVFSLRGP